ncbi:hypothetical protein NLI96_g4772 [Meripilus lineatus]|uniref:LysM domain-containing protein n=1 Tax=Meripilus lineatus TaxID=2056292 RepID=A0AAD5YFE6_9APHY|nr:hypothetical protein NLI96_g4772 [Physisporinus lineatus]
MLAFVSLIVYTAIAVVFSMPGSTASVPVTQTCATGRSYIVKRSDVCNSICQTQDVSNFQLSFANPQINADCTNLAVGEMLCLGLEGQDCRDVYTVQPGDTCDLIADIADIDVSTLEANNPNIDSGCDNLEVGEVSMNLKSSLFPYDDNNGFLFILQ